MSAVDKIKNETKRLIGKGKEVVGDLTDNERLEAEGRSKQTDADARKTAENVKDTAHDAKETVKDTFRKDDKL